MRYTHANYLQPNKIISSWLKDCALQRQSHFWTVYTQEKQCGINIYMLCDLRGIHMTRLCILAVSQKIQLHRLVQYVKSFTVVLLYSLCSSVIQCEINIPQTSPFSYLHKKTWQSLPPVNVQLIINFNVIWQSPATSSWHFATVSRFWAVDSHPLTSWIIIKSSHPTMKLLNHLKACTWHAASVL
jgi:hypothetical protein